MRTMKTRHITSTFVVTLFRSINKLKAKQEYEKNNKRKPNNLNHLKKKSQIFSILDTFMCGNWQQHTRIICIWKRFACLFDDKIENSKEKEREREWKIFLLPHRSHKRFELFELPTNIPAILFLYEIYLKSSFNFKKKKRFYLPIYASSASSSSSPRNQDVTVTYFRTCSGIKHLKKATFPKNTSVPSTLISYGCLTTWIKKIDKKKRWE